MEEKKVDSKKNVYEKLQLCRTLLNSKNIKKSGKNDYSGYEYFELKDFLPIVNKLFEENKLASIFNLSTEKATLEIINTDDVEDTIIFSIPVADATIKGSSPVQALGGQITYLRRYLYINALEIAENDMQNKEMPNFEKSENKVSNSEVPNDEVYIKLLADFNELVIATETNQDSIYKCYKVKNNSEMTIEQLKDAIEILKKKPIKKKEEVF